MTATHSGLIVLRARAASCMAIAAVLALSFAGKSARAAPAREYAVKAAVLANLPRFVEWPARAGEPPLAPIVMGVIAPDPFGGVLDQLVASPASPGRALVVRHIVDPIDAKGIHILFVARDSHGAAAIGRQAPIDVLTVGETDGFLASGGHIRLALVEGRVKFKVNARAAERAGLKIRSQLLSMARRPTVRAGAGS